MRSLYGDFCIHSGRSLKRKIRQAKVANQTLEFCRVRGEERLEVVVGVVDRSGLVGWLGSEKAKIPGPSGRDGIIGI